MQLPHGPSLLTHPDTVNHRRAAALITDNDLPPFLFHLFFLLSLLFLLIRSHKAAITEADLTEPKPPPPRNALTRLTSPPRDESQEFAPPPPPAPYLLPSDAAVRLIRVPPLLLSGFRRLLD